MVNVIEVHGRDVAPVAAWILDQANAGARLFALEGFMAAGKSCLAKRLAQAVEGLAVVAVDDYFDEGGGNRKPWNEGLRASDLQRDAQRLAESGLVLVEGVVAWEAIAPQYPASGSRRIFLKRMQAPGLWADELDLIGVGRRAIFKRSLHERHRASGYGQTADLIVERITTGEEGICV